jgi:hypothetical protein
MNGFPQGQTLLVALPGGLQNLIFQIPLRMKTMRQRPARLCLKSLI